MLAPATITRLRKLDPGGVRLIELTLPGSLTIDGNEQIIQDGMRPGSGFWIQPLDARTTKRWQLYVRSNCSIRAQRRLETVVTETYDESDTWSWWQTQRIKVGDVIGIRVDAYPREGALKIHETKDLALEPDSWWFERDFAAIAFSTGIAPFLAHIRYMTLFGFGRAFNRFGRGAHYVLVVSVREPSQLICHEELLAVEGRFPENFRYHPVLTRTWSDDWPYTRGRVIGMDKESGAIDISALLHVVPDIEYRHVRLCGGKEAVSQVVRGLQEHKIAPLSMKVEVE